MKPLLHLPDASDPYYNTIASGGYNPCILGNPAARVPNLNILPNCVGFGTGRFNQLGNYGKCKYLGDTNAANFVKLARSQGLEVRKKPTLGGVMVWSGGKGGYGHIACVEIVGETIVITSESEYYGKPFVNYTRYLDDGNWRKGCYWMTKDYKYLGCIVNPAITEDKMTYEEFCEMMKRWLAENGLAAFRPLMSEWLAEQASKPPDAWAVPAITYCIEHDLLAGDPDGKFRAKSFLERQEFAAYLAAHDK